MTNGGTRWRRGSFRSEEMQAGVPESRRPRYPVERLPFTALPPCHQTIVRKGISGEAGPHTFEPGCDGLHKAGENALVHATDPKELPEPHPSGSRTRRSPPFGWRETWASISTSGWDGDGELESGEEWSRASRAPPWSRTHGQCTRVAQTELASTCPADLRRDRETTREERFGIMEPARIAVGHERHDVHEAPCGDAKPAHGNVDRGLARQGVRGRVESHRFLKGGFQASEPRDLDVGQLVVAADDRVLPCRSEWHEQKR